MEIMIRVMCRDKEIDRITRPLRMDRGQPAVTYKKLLWPVTDACIQIEPDSDSKPLFQDPDAIEWAKLVTRLFPLQLPVHRNECQELLRNCLGKSFPDSVIRAAASLSCSDLELEARELLIDFLREKKDSEQLFSLMQKYPSFCESPNILIPSEGLTKISTSEEFEMSGGAVIEDDTDLDWDWAPTLEMSAPSIDDRSLRENAKRTQQTIGTYQPAPQGAVFANLNEPLDEASWLPEPPPKNALWQETALIERTAKLGKTSLNLLRYFADNPGDRAVHAESVLGYDTSDINKLLSGALSQYVKKNRDGGWECQLWMHDILTLLDEA